MPNKIKPVRIGYAEDDSCGGYEWGYAGVYEYKGQFYICKESGSCNGPSSYMWPSDACVGPEGSLGGLIDETATESDVTLKRALYDAVVNQIDTGLDDLKKILGL